MSSSNGMIEYTRLYKMFRQELDEMCVPMIIEELKRFEPIITDGKFVGMVGGYVDYIDCVYIEPEYRRRGLAKKAVLNFVKGNLHYGIKLHIINTNEVALDFWNSIFELKEIGSNSVDTLYEITGIKEGKDA